MRQPAEKYIVRLPEGVRERIRANAVANHRSMNAEIVHYIVDYLDRTRAAEESEGPVSGGALPGHGHQPTLEKADERGNG